MLRLLLAVALLVLLCAGMLWAALTYRPQSVVPLVQWTALHFFNAQLQITALGPVELGKDASLQATGVRLANPEWDGAEPLLSADRLRLVINLPSLLGRSPILVRDLEAEGVRVDLRAPADAPPNWVLSSTAHGPREDGEGSPLLPMVFEHIAVSGLNVTYVDPGRDVAAQVPWISLQRDDETGLSQASVDGSINGLPLHIQGLIGPTEALITGRDLTLDAALQLARLEMHVRGVMADATTLSGTDLVLKVRAPQARPFLDLLGLQEVRDGPLSFDGRLADAAPGLRIDAEGNVADFSLSASGVIEVPRQLDGVELTVFAGGPSLAEAGALFGLEGWRPVPFGVSGQVRRQGRLFRIDDGTVKAGQGELRIHGVLPNFPSIDDWDARVSGTEVNLGVLGSLLGVDEMPAVVVGIEGQLSADENGLELVQLTVDGDDVQLGIEGIVGAVPEFENTALNVRLTGDALQDLAAPLGLAALPAGPFTLTGRLERQLSGWRVGDTRLALHGLRAEMSAELDRLISPQQVHGELRLVSDDLPVTLREFGVDITGARHIPLDVSASVRLGEDGFLLDSLHGQLGGIAMTGSGLLSSAAGLAGSRLRLQGQGDSLGDAVGTFIDTDLQDMPFELSLDAIYHAPLLELKTLQLDAGRNQLSGNLRLASEGGSDIAEGSVSLHGASARELLAIGGFDIDVTDGPYTVASDVHMSDGGLRLSNIATRFPDGDLAGTLALQYGAVPRLDMDLSSERLLLAFLRPRSVPADAQVLDEAELEKPPTSEEVKERVIPDTALPLDWLSHIEGHWRYRADSILAREGLSSSLAVDLEIAQGTLRTRELRWRGPLSTGWMDLSIDAAAPRPLIELEMVSHRLPLLWLAAGGEVPVQETLYRTHLKGQGATYRELAASLNGALLLYSTGARISTRGLDLILGDVLATIFDRLDPTTQTSPFVELECSVGAFRARDGVVNVVPGLVMRVDAVDITSQGRLNLNNESIDINFNTHSRKGIGVSAGKAITPYLKLAGTFAHPWITLDPEAVARSGSVAVATGGISILVEGLYDRWIKTARSPCRELYKQIRKEPDYQALLALPDPGVDSPAGDNFNQDSGE